MAWLLHLYLAAPGFLSFDAAFQLWQARTGQYDNMHPVAMTLLWQLCNALLSPWQGPMALLLLQSGMYFIAIASLTLSFSRYGFWRALVFGVVLAFWPPFFLLQAHVWKDCLLASFWALSIAILISEVQNPAHFKHTKLITAAALLLFSALLRHNAILALPPMFFWISVRFLPAHRRAAVVLAIAIVPLTLLANSTLARLIDAKASPAWAVTALFDLTAEAIATGEWYVPANLRVDVPITRFAEAFKPYSGVPLFSASIIVDGVSMELTDQDKASLMRNWLSLPFRSPLVYLRHRAAMARIFLLPRSADLPPQLWFAPISMVYGDNPVFELPRLAQFDSAIHTLSSQLWCGIGLYLLMGIAAYWRLRRAQDLEARLGKTILLASACGFLPLLVLINATEFRYGFTAMFSALLLLLWSFLRPASPGNDSLPR